MKLKIEIEIDNAAFEEGGNGNECARILRRFAQSIETVRLEPNPLLTTLRDFYGNQVGKAKVTR